VFLLVLLSCGGGNTGVRATDVRIEGARGQLVIHAEVADSDVLRARGLMNRTSLAADRGMLFLWTDTAVRRFYMKDTLIPLDLISIRARRVVGVTTMQPCHIADCPTTKTPAADAALEVPAGTAKRAGISAGALVTYQLPN
jgi:hypothetical protein